MANKFTTKVTNEGLNLLQLASQQDKKVEFINVIASSTIYGDERLILETYDDINSRASKNQTGTINNLTIDKNITKMELVFDGHDIKHDYTLNSIFLIAKLKDSQDLKLFAIIKANQPQYMNSYDGSGSTNLQINLGVKFSNNDKVTLQIDTAAIATLGDLSNLRNETQAKLDKETTRAQSEEKRIDDKINYLTNNKSIKEVTVNDMNDLVQEGIYFSKKQLNNLDTRFAGENNFIIITGNQDYISQIVITELGEIISRYREDGEWLEWIKQIHYRDLKRLPLNEINPGFNDLVETVSEIKNRPPTGYALDTSTKPWTVWFDNGCGFQMPNFWNNKAFYTYGANNTVTSRFDIYEHPRNIIKVSKGVITPENFKNKEKLDANYSAYWNEKFIVLNPIRNRNDYDWSNVKFNDMSDVNSQKWIARTLYELGIWSGETFESFGAVRKAGN
ncbi:phage tail-collar fiber domain-containing protein [Ligilactobacillus salivarius]|uniref:phage tail-collar fiber domain-containing protein n=1 Tax=Ligilactobacillus salivarius TaxID=1624 RepID=UPI001CBAEC09|nr:phage tail protein [Ligilactobacillus salivarius]MBZ4031487.1 phage tail protein [Ligilactobacillus salivarius]